MTTIELLRQFRIGDYAIFDFVVSFLGVYLIAPFLSKIFLKFRIDIPRASWLFLTLPISILIHLITGQITNMTRDFFDLSGYFFLKIIILSLLYFGLRNIKIVKKKK